MKIKINELEYYDELKQQFRKSGMKDGLELMKECKNTIMLVRESERRFHSSVVNITFADKETVDYDVTYKDSSGTYSTPVKWNIK